VIQVAQALRNPTDHAQSGSLQDSLQNLMETVTQRAMGSMTEHLGGATERLTDYAQGGGSGLLSAVTGIDKPGSPVKSILGAGLSSATGKVKESLGGVAGSLLGSKSKGGDKVKVTNIIEQIDVGVPIELAYRQWTEFGEFAKFMKKVENVEQVSDEKVKWKAQVFWSHRTWESTITEQVPNERIVWRSSGDKGYVDGAVTFHELAPDLTRIILVLEYHPKGLFERTGNLWRAQGRRVRLELKHFQRHVMTSSLLHPDEVEGWEGEIHDGEVVSSDGSRAAQDQESSTRKPRKTAARSGSSGERRPAAKAATSSRRTPTKSASNRSGAKKATKSTSSGRKQAAKASGSSRRRSPAKKRS
jgi:uncharacterized membrane protein